MLNYLVGSRTRRELLRLLWRDGKRGTASSLARRAGLPVAASYAELARMCKAGVATASVELGQRVYEADRQCPHAAALELLLRAESGCGVPSEPVHQASQARRQAVRRELGAHGAALWGETDGARPTTALPELVAEACALAHSDASVAKVLPHFLLLKKHELSFEVLKAALADRRQQHTAGFLLAVSHALSADAQLAMWSEALRDRRRTKVRDFFEEASTPRRRALAERRTPQLARDWQFRLNMTLDDFRSVMQKHPVDDHLPD